MTYTNSIRALPAPVGGRTLAPTVGLGMQGGLLAALGATTGVHLAGGITGVVFGLTTWALLQGGVRRAGLRSFGPANTITLTRAVLVGGVAALTADSFTRDVPVGVVVLLAGLALLFDAVDGPVARRTGTTSAVGARFDMEVDAFLILVLSVSLTRTVGSWVLAIGLLRYAFLTAGWLLPWLTVPLRARFSRKVVAALQGVVLVVAVAGVLPPAATVAMLLVALAALCWSFGQDVVWLARPDRHDHRKSA